MTKSESATTPLKKIETAKTLTVDLDAFHKTRPRQHHLSTFDVFAGAGGFSLGFSFAGYQPKAAIEYDAWACDTLRENHPDMQIVQGDIRSIKDSELADLGRNTDILLGGPPCQGFSVANNSAGDPKDPRNSLFMEFLRAADVCKPKAILMENVPGLLRRNTASGGRVIDLICSEFESIGYFPHLAVLHAKDFGVPQIRPRLFILGMSVEVSQPFPAKTHGVSTSNLDTFFSEQLIPYTTINDAISDLPELRAREGAEEQPYTEDAKTELQSLLRAGSTEIFNHKAMNHSKRIVERFASIAPGQSGKSAPVGLRAKCRSGNGELSGKDYDQNNRRMRGDAPCHTIPASYYANFVHPTQHRNFTAREGARLQTFPDWYRFRGKPTLDPQVFLKREGRISEKHLCQYNQIGNAVPPLLAMKLGEHLLQLMGGVSAEGKGL